MYVRCRRSEEFRESVDQLWLSVCALQEEWGVEVVCGPAKVNCMCAAGGVRSWESLCRYQLRLNVCVLQEEWGVEGVCGPAKVKCICDAGGVRSWESLWTSWLDPSRRRRPGSWTVSKILKKAGGSFSLYKQKFSFFFLFFMIGLVCVRLKGLCQQIFQTMWRSKMLPVNVYYLFVSPQMVFLVFIFFYYFKF